MLWPAEQFKLQIQFSRKVAQVLRLAQEDVLLAYTSFYGNFGIRGPHTTANSLWQDYLIGYREADNPAEWTYRFYIERTRKKLPPYYGCFS